MAFQRGQRVEVLSQENGFQGSLFAAIIVSKVSDNNFVVQYSTLFESQHEGYKSEFQPLREFCKLNEIRPTPPSIYVSRFWVKDKVDAYYNDGWWAGEITRCINERLDKMYYLVYFKRFDEEIWFKFEDLRVHQDWSKGQWTVPRKVRRPLGSKRKLIIRNDDHRKVEMATELEM